MLKFNRNEKNEYLGDQFDGITQEFIKENADRWKETWDKIDEIIEAQVKAQFDNDENHFKFDSTEAFNVFFAAFDTQELQNLALIQILMNDVNRRVRNVTEDVAKENIFGKEGIAGMLAAMLADRMKDKEEGENDDEGFDEDLL